MVRLERNLLGSGVTCKGHGGSKAGLAIFGEADCGTIRGVGQSVTVQRDADFAVGIEKIVPVGGVVAVSGNGDKSFNIAKLEGVVVIGDNLSLNGAAVNGDNDDRADASHGETVFGPVAKEGE